MKLLIFCSTLLLGVPLQAMRAGASFYADAGASFSSQAGTQPLSQEQVDNSDVETIANQVIKDDELDRAVRESNEKRVMTLLKHGATFTLAVERAVHYDNPDILKQVLAFDSNKDIYCRNPYSPLADKDPVIIACEHARRTNNIDVLMVLLKDKRVDAVDHIRKGRANCSRRVCALFLLAAQSDFTQEDRALASRFPIREGVHAVLYQNCQNFDALYNEFRNEPPPGLSEEQQEAISEESEEQEAIYKKQKKAIHDMLLTRHGTGSAHLIKAARCGHEYMVARLLFTIPSGPFEKQEIAQAYQEAQANGKNGIAKIFENKNRLSMFLPIPWCQEFTDIVVSQRPKVNVRNLLYAQAGITPALAQAKMRVDKKLAVIKQLQDGSEQVRLLSEHKEHVVNDKKRKGNDPEQELRSIKSKICIDQSK